MAALHGVGHALPRDRGPHWMTYFEVADTDRAAARVVELGGRVLQPPREGSSGRVATVADPEGCVDRHPVRREPARPAGERQESAPPRPAPQAAVCSGTVNCLSQVPVEKSRALMTTVRGPTSTWRPWLKAPPTATSPPLPSSVQPV